eukprot:3922117-Amphidinium_carterae.2
MQFCLGLRVHSVLGESRNICFSQFGEGRRCSFPVGFRTCFECSHFPEQGAIGSTSLFEIPVTGVADITELKLLKAERTDVDLCGDR